LLVSLPALARLFVARFENTRLPPASLGLPEGEPGWNSTRQVNSTSRRTPENVPGTGRGVPFYLDATLAGLN
jgi:hypothetical protein